jgi:hydroxymethylglutaryl-CoA lyase
MQASTIHHPPSAIHLVECPRDAMQGWPRFIPTKKKVEYLNSLLQVGFYTLDCGSFVSAKAIPQMADTKQVVPQLNLVGTETKLLTIVANFRGAEDAITFDEITYLGFPFSVSPTFQLRNTNSTMETSFRTVEAMQNLCAKNNKQLVIYLSMGFGNPYGDDYNEAIVMEWLGKMVALDIKIISLADTVGLATPLQISSLLNQLLTKYPETEIGVHLHSSPNNWQAKFEAAVNAGCTRFDGALKGIGGCPMANDELVGNMDSEKMISYLEKKNLWQPKNAKALENSLALASSIFV